METVQRLFAKITLVALECSKGIALHGDCKSPHGVLLVIGYEENQLLNLDKNTRTL